MKKIILSLVVLMPTPLAAYEHPPAAELWGMNCTQAVALISSQIKETWNRGLKKGEAETLAIQMLSQPADSPCHQNQLTPQSQK